MTRVTRLSREDPFPHGRDNVPGDIGPTRDGCRLAMHISQPVTLHALQQLNISNGLLNVSSLHFSKDVNMMTKNRARSISTPTKRGRLARNHHPSVNATISPNPPLLQTSQSPIYRTTEGMQAAGQNDIENTFPSRNLPHSRNPYSRKTSPKNANFSDEPRSLRVGYRVQEANQQGSGHHWSSPSTSNTDIHLGETYPPENVGASRHRGRNATTHYPLKSSIKLHAPQLLDPAYVQTLCTEWYKASKKETMNRSLSVASDETQEYEPRPASPDLSSNCGVQMRDRPLDRHLGHIPRVPFTPSMMYAYAMLRGGGCNIDDDPILPALFPGPSRDLSNQLVQVPRPNDKRIRETMEPG